MAIKPIGCRADKEEICLCKSLFETHFISGNKSPEIRGANLAYPWAHKHFNYALDIIVARNLRGKARTSNAGHVCQKKIPNPKWAWHLLWISKGLLCIFANRFRCDCENNLKIALSHFGASRATSAWQIRKPTSSHTCQPTHTHTHAGPTHTHSETSSVKVWKFHFTNGQREKSSVGIEWNANKVFNWKWDIIFIL